MDGEIIRELRKAHKKREVSVAATKNDMRKASERTTSYRACVQGKPPTAGAGCCRTMCHCRRREEPKCQTPSRRGPSWSRTARSYRKSCDSKVSHVHLAGD